VRQGPRGGGEPCPRRAESADWSIFRNRFFPEKPPSFRRDYRFCPTDDAALWFTIHLAMARLKPRPKGVPTRCLGATMVRGEACGCKETFAKTLIGLVFFLDTHFKLATVPGPTHLARNELRPNAVARFPSSTSFRWGFPGESAARLFALRTACSSACVAALVRMARRITWAFHS
jgi:hypothetical protein